ncbi:MAG: hypothetical protein ABSA47_02765 [Verrucomicrobiota bacterium]
MKILTAEQLAKWFTGAVVLGRDDMDMFKVYSEPDAQEWQWCLHCERCYPLGLVRIRDDLQMCPYEGCGGDTVLDACGWHRGPLFGTQGLEGAELEAAQASSFPGYPLVPVVGVVYPLYPEERKRKTKRK